MTARRRPHTRANRPKRPAKLPLPSVVYRRITAWSRTTVPAQTEQVLAVARDQVVGLPGHRHGEQEIVGGIGAAVDLWQRSGEYRERANFIHHGAGGGRAEEPLQSRIPADAPELVQLLLARNQPENAPAPALIQVAGRASRDDQGADQDVGIENDPQKRLRADAGATDGLDGFGDGSLDLFRRHIGVGRLGVRDGEVQNPPVHGVFHEFRQIAFARASLCQVGTQRNIGIFRNHQGPANSLGHKPSLRHINIYLSMSVAQIDEDCKLRLRPVDLLTRHGVSKLSQAEAHQRSENGA